MDWDLVRAAAAADVVEISQLVLTEREAVAHAWWDFLADCYEDDAELRLPDFRGSVSDYIDRRRVDRSGGRRVRWRLATPVVHLNDERAVVTADGTADLGPADGPVESTVHARLIGRVRRRQQAWRLVRLEALLQKVELVSTPTGSWPTLAPSVTTPRVISGDDLHRLVPVIRVDGELAAEPPLDGALAWADLRPARSDDPLRRLTDP